MIRNALIALSVFVSVVVASCAPPRAPMDHANGRAAFLYMGMGVTAAAEQCTRHARWLASSGFDAAADDLFSRCTHRLGPARDALVFNIEHVDAWSPETEPRIGCTGKAVHVALVGLADDFAAFRVKVPVAMFDASLLGEWAARWAPPTCDARSPTTYVTMTIDPSIPNVEPAYPTGFLIAQ